MRRAVDGEEWTNLSHMRVGAHEQRSRAAETVRSRNDGYREHAGRGERPQANAVIPRTPLGPLPPRPQAQRERSAKIKLKIKKTCSEN